MRNVNVQIKEETIVVVLLVEWLYVFVSYVIYLILCSSSLPTLLLLVIVAYSCETCVQPALAALFSHSLLLANLFTTY